MIEALDEFKPDIRKAQVLVFLRHDAVGLPRRGDVDIPLFSGQRRPFGVKNPLP